MQAALSSWYPNKELQISCLAADELNLDGNNVVSDERNPSDDIGEIEKKDDHDDVDARHSS
jgi:hypothetical protein